MAWEKATRGEQVQVEELRVESPGLTDTLKSMEVRYYQDSNDNGVPEDPEVRFMVEYVSPTACAVLRIDGPKLETVQGLKCRLIVTLSGGVKLYSGWRL